MSSKFEEAQKKARKAELAERERQAEAAALAEMEREEDELEAERIWKEVNEVGGWEAWTELQKKREQSIYDNAPPYEGSIEDMLEDYEPEEPEGDE